jgi:hypothetical protein
MTALAFYDTRWNSWRWRPLLEKYGHLRMFVNPDVIKTATFLFVAGKLSSTVFFVRWPLPGQIYAYYAVTTRHSILHPKIKNPEVSIRFNRHGGNAQDEFFQRSAWHEYEPTDIAVLPIEIPHDASIQFVNASDFASTRDDLRRYMLQGDAHPTPAMPYGTGDEVYTVGLFEGRLGEHLAQPVVRFGHIALKPAEGEKISAEIIPGDDLTPIDGFLVEMATWRGQSGSPVFLRVDPSIEDQLFNDSYLRAKESNYLIGMIQGFYPVGYQDVQIDGKDVELSGLQMGIGIVIPANDIAAALMQPALKEHRENLQKEHEQNPKIRPRGASIQEPESD